MTADTLGDERVRAALGEQFPNALSNTCLDRDAPIDLPHEVRSCLLSFLKSIRPSAEASLLNSIRTWGDVYDWFPISEGAETSVSPFGDGQAPIAARVQLRPLDPSDTGLLYGAACDPQDGYRWRFRGRTPSFQEFEQSLFDGILAQYMVVEDGPPIGLVVAYEPDHTGGTCYFGFFRLSSRGKSTSGSMVEGAALMINHVFNHWPFRKVYFELPEYNMYLVSGLLSLGIASEEGRMREFYYHHGRYWDKVFVAVGRAEWNEQLSPWFSQTVSDSS